MRGFLPEYFEFLRQASGVKCEKILLSVKMQGRSKNVRRSRHPIFKRCGGSLPKQL